MAQFFQIHSKNPPLRLVREVACRIAAGAVAVYPTDSGYALGCAVGHPKALDRILQLQAAGETDPLTLLCRDLSAVAQYGVVGNSQYRLLKKMMPGAYTVLLKAKREAPKRLLCPNQTIWVRVSGHRVVSELLGALAGPLVLAPLVLPQAIDPLAEAEDIRRHVERRVDLMIDGGICPVNATTRIDLTAPCPRLLWMGCGPVAPLGDFIRE